MKKFLMIWIGELISSIGSGMTAFALGVYAYQLTGSASAGALITLLSFLPMILLGTIGGVLADKMDRRLMMICGDFFSAFGLVYILICVKGGHAAIWQICVGVVISAIFTSLIEPAYKATVTDLLTQEEFARASGMVQIASSAKFLISPFLAGIVLNLGDISTILYMDIATFGITVITLSLVRKDTKAPIKYNEKKFELVTELKEGWKGITAQKGVLTLVLLMTAVCFYMGFIQILMTPMVLSFSDAKSLGYMESISASGMLVGSVLIGIFNIKKHYLRTLAAGLFIGGLSIAAMGSGANIWLIGGAAIIFFTTLPYVNTCADVMIRVNVPNELQGRAWGIIGFISQMGYVAAYALAGPLADYLFNPMLEEGGILAETVGKVIGVGAGRGIGLMLIISGLLLSIVGIYMGWLKELRAIEPKEISASDETVAIPK